MIELLAATVIVVAFSLCNILRKKAISTSFMISPPPTSMMKGVDGEVYHKDFVPTARFIIAKFRFICQSIFLFMVEKKESKKSR